MTHPQLVTKDQGQTVSVIGQRYKLLIDGKQTGNQFSAFECFVPSGNGTPHHIHHNEDETFYVLAGEFEFSVGDQTHRGKPGDFLWAPRDVQHTFRCVSAVPGKMLLYYFPAGLETFFLSSGTPLDNAASEAIAPTDAEIKRLMERAPAYGLEFLPGDNA